MTDEEGGSCQGGAVRPGPRRLSESWVEHLERVADEKRSKGPAPEALSKSGQPFSIQEPAELGARHLEHTLEDLERHSLSAQRQLERLNHPGQPAWGLLADATFLVLAAWNAYRTTDRLKQYDRTGAVTSARESFMEAQPELQNLRNFLEHLDDRRLGEVQGKKSHPEVVRLKGFAENPTSVSVVRESIAQVFSHDSIIGMQYADPPTSDELAELFQPTRNDESLNEEDLILITNIRQHNLTQLVRHVLTLASVARNPHIVFVSAVLDMTEGEWVGTTEALDNIQSHPKYWADRLDRWQVVLRAISDGEDLEEGSGRPKPEVHG